MSTPDLPLTEARLLAAFGETTLYGIYIVTCFHCWSTLFRSEDRSGHIRWVMVTVAMSLFVIATAHLALNLYQIINAFVFYDGPGGAIVPLMDITSWDNVLSSVLSSLQCTIGDAVPIYRVYIVYERSWKIVLPSICLFLGGFSCTVYLIYLEATLRVNLINVKRLVPEGTAFWALTVAQNVITTALLVYRIWCVSHRVEQFGAPSVVSSRSRGTMKHGKLNAVMRVIAGSGALYTFVALLAFIAIARGSAFGYPLSDMAVVVVGIAFNLIITRSSHAAHKEEQTTNAYPSRTTSIPLQSSSKHNTFISFRNNNINLNNLSNPARDSAISLPLRSPTLASPGDDDLQITVTRHVERHSQDLKDIVTFAV